MGLRLFEFDARIFFGLLVFIPKRVIYRDSVIRVLCMILLRAIGFHPKANIVLYGNDYVLVLWNSIWPSVLITD